MRKMIALLAAAVVSLAACKEQPLFVDLGGNYNNWDTSFSTSVETPDAKMYLLEELTGVRCVNCPEGAAYLEELNEQNDHKFVIVGLNTGSLTNPIPGRSVQDFRTEDGDQLRTQIFGGEGNKPAVSFDRLPLSSGQNRYFVEAKTNWAQAIAEMKSIASTTPLNLKVEASYDQESDEYKIQVRVHFTQEVSEPVALNVFLIENDIMDAFVTGQEFIQYNHVFRKAVTPPIGRRILADESTKMPGLTYLFRTSFSIDKADQKQQHWVPEKMKVVAFVSKAATDSKQVLQVVQTNLK